MKIGGNIPCIMRIKPRKFLLASEVISVLGGQNRGYFFDNLWISTELKMLDWWNVVGIFLTLLGLLQKKILASEVINVLGGQNRGYSYCSISISTKLRMHRLKKFAEKSFSQNRDYSKKYFCWPPRSLPTSEVKKQAVF